METEASGTLMHVRVKRSNAFSERCALGSGYRKKMVDETFCLARADAGETGKSACELVDGIHV